MEFDILGIERRGPCTPANPSFGRLRDGCCISAHPITGVDTRIDFRDEYNCLGCCVVQSTSKSSHPVPFP